ncbi:Ribosomal protein S18 acetylase RimI [Formosa sp. Hel1_31_208]|uniref:GNAT family N-acetyltransferase n=1 Tax=Formosa sp. Hel1_31_208 TaxID=1798225 RepID=UPI00087A6D0B|nr:GNAT family N-acetyltransferase [Formosa sp. Hel1_31_208]SDR69432.1 Ribosomal protein S18 acetylase RimI [Formosa sp. Hel1_31_208]
MTFSIRQATKNDMSKVLDLIYELAIFEKEPDAVKVTVDDLVTHGFGDHPKFQCFVAEHDGIIQGMALVYERFSTWKGPVLHLEDLVVTQTMRGAGLGTALLDHVVKYGHSRGVKRIGWEVLDWNELAIRFYEKKGAIVKRDWDLVQLNEQEIETYIANI